MEPLIDEILDRPEQNNFLSLPEDARTHVLFVKGGAHVREGGALLPPQLRVRGPDGSG